MKQSCHACGGFTLVEVMVAMMVMAILAVMAWQGVDGIMRTRDASQARLERTLRLNTIVGQLEHDLQSLQETTAVPGLTFDGATLRITRRAEAGLQVVTWSLRPNPDGTIGGNLLRWAGPPARTSSELQEVWIQTQQFQGVEPGHLRTLTGVTEWQLYCFRGNSWSNCQSSGDVTPVAPPPPASGASVPQQSQAPQPQRQVLPAGVRAVIEFAGPDMNGQLTRDIALGPQLP